MFDETLQLYESVSGEIDREPYLASAESDSIKLYSGEFDAIKIINGCNTISSFRGFAKLKKIQKIQKNNLDRVHPMHPLPPYKLFWKPITDMDRTLKS